ncbi:MAG TPA: hypothetical protein VGX23_04005 [Actinocrinis sp.]|nr:hypothetical protein [Actinocrinis sp.]
MESSKLLTAEPLRVPARPAGPAPAGRRWPTRATGLPVALLLISACTAVHALDSVGGPVGGRARFPGPAGPPAALPAAALGFACAPAMALAVSFARRDRPAGPAARAAGPVRPPRSAARPRGVPGAVDD